MRIASCVISISLALGLATPAAGAPGSADHRDGRRAFAFESGRWITHVRRLDHPLSGSSTWLEYEGTTTVTSLLDGRANVAELRISGPAGRIEGVALRLYEPQAHRWAIHYASAANGELTSPLYGNFGGGVGHFEGPDRLGDKPIIVRFEIRESKPGTWRFEQSFSADDGRTWELNWIAEDRRAK